jgi:hypothetical protein
MRIALVVMSGGRLLADTGASSSRSGSRSARTGLRASARRSVSRVLRAFQVGNTMPRIWSESPRSLGLLPRASLTVAEWASESEDADRDKGTPARRSWPGAGRVCRRRPVRMAHNRRAARVCATRLRQRHHLTRHLHRDRRQTRHGARHLRWSQPPPSTSPRGGDAATWKPPSALSPPPHATARRTSCQGTEHRRSPWRSLASLVEGPRDGGALAGRSVPRRPSGS